MKKEQIQTLKKDIIKYWFCDEKIQESDLGVEIPDAHERCWRCGCKKTLERRYIVPEFLGGEDTPSNFVLLCKRCNLESPNVQDPEVMWDWIKAYSVAFYDIFWLLEGAKEYEFIYNVSLRDELEDKGVDGINRFLRIIKEEIKAMELYFGNPYLNAATIAGIIKIALDSMEE